MVFTKLKENLTRGLLRLKAYNYNLIMAKLKTNYSITVQMGEIQRRHFIKQSEVAEWLGIKNSSKTALESRCRVMGYQIEFN